jgi:hypothetical protein
MKDALNRIILPDSFINFGGQSGKVEISLSTRHRLELKWGLQALKSEGIQEKILIKNIGMEALERDLQKLKLEYAT